MQQSDKPSDRTQTLDPAIVATSAFSTGHADLDSIGRLVLDTVGEGIFCVGRDGLTTFVNPAAARMLGWAPEELIDRRQHEICHHSYPDGSSYPLELCRITSVLRTGRTEHSEDEVFWRRDGTSFPVSYTSTPIVCGDRITAAAVVFRDISERVRRECWQRGRDTVFRAITMHAPLNHTLQLLADAYAAYRPGFAIAVLLREPKTGGTLQLAASSSLSTALRAQLKSVAIERGLSACGHAAFIGEEFATVDLASDPTVNLATGPRHQGYTDPETSALRCLVLPMADSGGQVSGVVAFTATITDLSAATRHIASGSQLSSPSPFGVAELGGFRGVRDLAQIAVEQCNLQTELVYQSRHDRLTGLPNWLSIEERLNHLICGAEKTNARIAVCSVDLDRFRRINENHGHILGDDLLQQIAARFRAIVRKGDTIGRQGGDEFIILLSDLSDASDADFICCKLLQALNEPFQIDGKELTVAANIGISIYPDHGRTAEMLVQHADTALNIAKEKGKANLQIFRPDLGQKVRELAALEDALQTALQKNEFYLMYQPLFDADRRIHGFEALLRWQHPELGLVSPDRFIPLAEETGLILPIGDWVLREACRQAMSWTSRGLADTRIFINISALQLGQPDFTHSVAYALKVSGLPPPRLALEVTESFIVPSFKKATQRLQPLQDLGVSIAIDDFGTGHSSFSVLHKLPIDAIKVDRSFVSRIDKDSSGLSTVRAIVQLAHQLGMKTVGEGVENEAQFRLLNEMGCDFYQGFLLSKPLHVDSVEPVFAELTLSSSMNVSSPTNPSPSGDRRILRRSA